MKLIKCLIVFLFISIALSSYNKIRNNFKRKRLDQMNSGICGFVGVLEAALDHKIKVKGIKPKEKNFQQFVPEFVRSFLTDSSNKVVSQSIFKQTNDFIDRFMPDVDKSVEWFSSYDEMISEIRTKYDKSLKQYYNLVGVFLSFENLKKVAEYAGLNIDDSKSHSISLNGPINKPINASELKSKKNCLVGISNPNKKWISGDDLYVDPSTNPKNISTSHWIYISKNEMLVNWNRKIDLNDALSTSQYISSKFGNRLSIITETLCLK